MFDGANDDDVWSTIEEAGMARDGKTVLYDGRTGEPFDNRISVGVMYMLKLAHMVDDKLHASFYWTILTCYTTTIRW